MHVPGLVTTLSVPCLPCSFRRRNYLRLDRPTMHFFTERLTATGVRTGDGDNADWYFIPVVLRKTSDGHLLNEAIRYISQVHPWWNQTAGHRHFVFALGEYMPCRTTDVDRRVSLFGLLHVSASFDGWVGTEHALRARGPERTPLGAVPDMGGRHGDGSFGQQLYSFGQRCIHARAMTRNA